MGSTCLVELLEIKPGPVSVGVAGVAGCCGAGVYLSGLFTCKYEKAET